jgi:hypothetical protein
VSHELPIVSLLLKPKTYHAPLVLSSAVPGWRDRPKQLFAQNGWARRFNQR